MQTIHLTVNDETSREYEQLTPEAKEQFIQDLGLLLKKAALDARSVKLKKLIRDINNRQDCTDINSELLLTLLPID